MPATFHGHFTGSSDPGGGAATPRPEAQPRQRGGPGQGERGRLGDGGSDDDRAPCDLSMGIVGVLFETVELANEDRRTEQVSGRRRMSVE